MSMTARRRGVTILEMFVGLIIFIPVVLLLIDLVLITIGVQINDHAAREADRLAASGDPTQANSRAQRVIDRISKSTAGYVSKLTLKSLTFNPANLLATEATMIPYGGVIQGTVTVNTQVTVTPILISHFCTAPFVFESSQSCPITYDVPNTAGGQVVPP
jgi:hypothetical protein